MGAQAHSNIVATTATTDPGTDFIAGPLAYLERYGQRSTTLPAKVRISQPPAFFIDDFDQQRKIAWPPGTEPSRFRALCVRSICRDAGLADDRRSPRLPGVGADPERRISGANRARTVPAVRRAASARRTDCRSFRSPSHH